MSQHHGQNQSYDAYDFDADLFTFDQADQANPVQQQQSTAFTPMYAPAHTMPQRQNAEVIDLTGDDVPYVLQQQPQYQVPALQHQGFMQYPGGPQYTPHQHQRHGGFNYYQQHQQYHQYTGQQLVTVQYVMPPQQQRTRDGYILHQDSRVPQLPAQEQRRRDTPAPAMMGPGGTQVPQLQSPDSNLRAVAVAAANVAREGMQGAQRPPKRGRSTDTVWEEPERPRKTQRQLKGAKSPEIALTKRKGFPGPRSIGTPNSKGKYPATQQPGEPQHINGKDSRVKDRAKPATKGPTETQTSKFKPLAPAGSRPETVLSPPRPPSKWRFPAKIPGRILNRWPLPYPIPAPDEYGIVDVDAVLVAEAEWIRGQEEKSMISQPQAAERESPEPESTEHQSTEVEAESQPTQPDAGDELHPENIDIANTEGMLFSDEFLDAPDATSEKEPSREDGFWKWQGESAEASLQEVNTESGIGNDKV